MRDIRGGRVATPLATECRILIAMAAVASGVATLPAAQQICPPRVQWQQTYGGNSSDYAAKLQPTSDGGFIIGGSSYTFFGNAGGGNKTARFYGNWDFWIVRADSNGSNLWDQSYGGAGPDQLSSVQQTSDGGFILGGNSGSLPGGNKTSQDIGGTDFWLVRTDGSGNKLWDQSFGGTERDGITSVQQTSDGGYILGGISHSQRSGNKTSAQFGMGDFWVVRTDGAGNKLWDRSFGGTEPDFLHVVKETSDGGFVLGGVSLSDVTGNKTSPRLGYRHGWLVRIDANGTMLWDRSFGGHGFNEIHSLVQMDDGGFLLGGIANSLTDRGWDFWVIRVDANGNQIWERSYGGDYNDYLQSVNRVADGGFILGGSSSSARGGTKTSPGYGGSDYWIVRIDQNGNQLWDESVGSRGSDYGIGAFQTSDGGFIAGGFAYDEGGNRTSSVFENGDFWVVKFQPETPGDCDGDGVPDVQDLCADTPAGTIVNSNGCAIEQLCPCTNDWRSTREYVRCVRGAADDFAQAGLISEAERQAIVDAAERTNCPPNLVRPGILAFGLTNVPLGQASLNGAGDGSGSESSWSGAVTVSGLGIDGLDGVSVLTGEADSGVFLYPYADIWGDYSGDWFTLGRAYGRINGTADAFISSLRVTKPGYETYPVAIDLTPLGPRSLTYHVFSNGTLVAEATTEGGTGGITIYADTYESPRGNPFWRMPDGSVGAMIEFTTPLFGSGEYHRNSISGPFGEAYGDQVFVRANQPANRVEFISRVDVTGFAGEFHPFSLLDERLGMFARPHAALGPVIMTAVDRRFTIAGHPNIGDQFGGVLVELDPANRFDADLEPLELANSNSSFLVSASGPSDIEDEENDDYSFAEARLRNQSGVLQLSAYFSPEYVGTNSRSLLEVKVYRNGSLVGSAIATNGTIVGTLTARNGDKVPEIVSTGISGNNSDSPPYFALSLRRVATFTARDGTALRGNHIRVGPIAPAPNRITITSFSMGTYGVPAFTITAEHSVLAPPPMSVVAASGALNLRWPVVNQPFVLESAPSLSGPFSAVTNDVEYIDSQNYLVLPVESAGNRFFRLRLSTD